MMRKKHEVFTGVSNSDVVSVLLLRMQAPVMIACCVNPVCVQRQIRSHLLPR
jgi:hypothetical protein